LCYRVYRLVPPSVRGGRGMFLKERIPLAPFIKGGTNGPRNKKSSPLIISWTAYMGIWQIG